MARVLPEADKDANVLFVEVFPVEVENLARSARLGACNNYTNVAAVKATRDFQPSASVPDETVTIPCP